jgi:hypothetical protein
VVPVAAASLRDDYEANRFTGGGGIQLSPGQLGTSIDNDPHTGG